MIYPDIVRFDFREEKSIEYHKKRIESYRTWEKYAGRLPVIGRLAESFFVARREAYERMHKEQMV